MHMYNFLCSDSLLYFFLFLSTLHSVYTRDIFLIFNFFLMKIYAIIIIIIIILQRIHNSYMYS